MRLIGLAPISNGFTLKLQALVAWLSFFNEFAQALLTVHLWLVNELHLLVNELLSKSGLLLFNTYP